MNLRYHFGWKNQISFAGYLDAITAGMVIRDYQMVFVNRVIAILMGALVTNATKKLDNATVNLIQLEGIAPYV